MSEQISYPERRDRCPFCELASAEERSGILAFNDHALAFYDNFPLNPGHALIVPRRHCPSVFGLTPDEHAAVFALLPEVRRIVAAEHDVEGWNVGINDGVEAGQTIPHLHVHLIPRLSTDADYHGDGNYDPRGGVRWVVPARAAYWPR